MTPDNCILKTDKTILWCVHYNKLIDRYKLCSIYYKVKFDKTINMYQNGNLCVRESTNRQMDFNYSIFYWASSAGGFCGDYWI